MRSVFAVVSVASIDMLNRHLDTHYRPQDGGGWLCETPERDAVLYIATHQGDDLLLFLDEGDLKHLPVAVNPRVLVAADVSGRHTGDAEVRTFVESLLTAFGGVAFDDYGGPWTLEEIRGKALKQGHPFFNYQGRYDELCRE
jgi:hypothetical protein